MALNLSFFNDPFQRARQASAGQLTLDPSLSFNLNLEKARQAGAGQFTPIPTIKTQPSAFSLKPISIKPTIPSVSRTTPLLRSSTKKASYLKTVNDVVTGDYKKKLKESPATSILKQQELKPQKVSLLKNMLTDFYGEKVGSSVSSFFENVFGKQAIDLEKIEIAEYGRQSGLSNSEIKQLTRVTPSQIELGAIAASQPLRAVTSKQASTLAINAIKSKITRGDLVEITAGRLKSGSKFNVVQSMNADPILRKELSNIAQNKKISLSEQIGNKIKSVIDDIIKPFQPKPKALPTGKIPTVPASQLAKPLSSRTQSLIPVFEKKLYSTPKVASLVTDGKAKVRQQGIKEVPSFEVPEETKIQFLQRQFQDKMNRLKVIQKATPAKVPETADAYLKQELFIGRASEKLDKIDKNVVEPILRQLRQNKIDIDDIGTYLYARHAPERNAKIQANFNKPNGSGMSDKQAHNIVRNFEKEGKLEILENTAQKTYTKITNSTLDTLEQGSLISTETADTLRKAYTSYIPLKGKEGVDNLAPIGKGFSITGKDVRRAFGRESRAKNPFVQAIVDNQNAVIRAEKNRVSQSLLKLVEENPKPDLWTVEKQQFVPRFNKTGELQFLDPKFTPADNVVVVKENGKTKLITIHDKVLANAMKNIGVEKGIKIFTTANNYLRAINTFLNPEFMLTNFERDLQTALINIGGEQSVKMAGRVAKNIPSAMQGIWQNIRKGDTTSAWAKKYQALKDTGGKTGFFDLKPVEDKLNVLRKRIETYNKNQTSEAMSKVLQGLGGYIKDMNEIVEMAVRTSAFEAAGNSGVSEEKAAQLAKNLTVNFNKKGNWGVALNNFYLFANAGIQGTARVLTGLRHKGVRRIVYGIIATSFALNELNRAINEREYKRIPEHVKNSNWIIMTPSGNYTKFKLPWGYNWFKVLGDVGNELVHGEITPGSGGKRLVVSLDDAYNPLSSASLGQLISPTVADPFVQVTENKNWFGGPIKPDQLQFGPKKRDSSLYWASVRPQTKAVTEWLNEVTGGSEIEAGFVDVSPEIIDHIIDFMGGGLGKFVSDTITTGVDISGGKFPDLKNIPFVRRAVAEPSEYFENQVIREIQDKSATKELNEVDNDRLRDALTTSRFNDKLDDGKIADIIKGIAKNQAKIKAGRVFTDLKNASQSEKEKALGELSGLEQAEFIKILKNQVEE